MLRPCNAAEDGHKPVNAECRKIEIVQDGEEYFGEKIGLWASKKTDSDFIMGLLYHPLDDIYHYSDLVKNAILL